MTKNPRNKDNNGTPSSGNDGAFSFKALPESSLGLDNENWPDPSDLAAEHVGDNENWPDPSEFASDGSVPKSFADLNASPESIVASLEEEKSHLDFYGDGDYWAAQTLERTLVMATRHLAANDKVHRFVIDNSGDDDTLRNVIKASNDPDVIDAAYRKARSLNPDILSNARMSILDNANTSADTLALLGRETNQVVQHPNTDSETLADVSEKVLDEYGQGDNVRDRISESTLYRIANHPNVSDDTMKTLGAHEHANIRITAVESGRLNDNQLAFFAEFDPSEMVRDRAATQVAMRDLRNSGHLTND